MFNPFHAITNLFPVTFGDRLAPEPADMIDYYEALLLAQPLVWEHDGQAKPGHIEAVVSSPYLPDDGTLCALWYSDVDYALDYLPVETAWQAVCS